MYPWFVPGTKSGASNWLIVKTKENITGKINRIAPFGMEESLILKFFIGRKDGRSFLMKSLFFKIMAAYDKTKTK